MHVTQIHHQEHEDTSTFTMQPPWAMAVNSSLRWTWVERHGPFLTIGELRNSTRPDTDTESDSKTAIMFNLDKLNEDRPEWVRSTAWHGRQIPDFTASLIDSVVHRFVETE